MLNFSSVLASVRCLMSFRALAARVSTSALACLASCSFFPASSTSGSGTYIVFSDGWDLDAYSRDLQYLYDWSPWTNCDNVQLWIKPVDCGDRVASDWDRIWNQLGGSLALWIMPQMDWGGFTLALCFVDGEDGAVVRRYCPGADR